MAYWLAIGAIVVAIAIYWMRPQRRATLQTPPRELSTLLTLTVAGLLTCLWSVSLESREVTYVQQREPLAIAIVYDLSPSMLAIPHPDFGEVDAPRFERGKDTLLAFVRALEERSVPVIVTVVGFTKNADVVMGWDQSTSQVRDVLEFAISPDLFGSSGTSLEAAAKALNNVFLTLPGSLRESRQLAIIVSDGEDTMRASSFEYAQEEMAAANFDTIAMQTGLIDENEGIPIYGRVGEFTGFRNVGGELHTVPNVDAMTSIAAASTGRGLHVRAESPNAIDSMVRFTLDDATREHALDASLASTFGLFAVIAMLCLIVIR